MGNSCLGEIFWSLQSTPSGNDSKTNVGNFEIGKRIITGIARTKHFGLQYGIRSLVTSPSLQISDDEFIKEQTKFKQDLGVIIKSKEYLVNIRTYMKIFGGLVHPTKKRYPVGSNLGCVGCHFEIGTSMFCHICGAYPAQRKNKRWFITKMKDVEFFLNKMKFNPKI